MRNTPLMEEEKKTEQITIKCTPTMRILIDKMVDKKGLKSMQVYVEGLINKDIKDNGADLH